MVARTAGLTVCEEEFARMVSPSGAALAAAFMPSEVPADLLRHLIEHDPRHDVGGAAGGERYNHIDRLGRPGLRPGLTRQHSEKNSGCQ